MATGGGGSVKQIENIFQLLESMDTVKDIRHAILDNLSSTKETWLIQLLADYYFQTQSTNVMEILAELQDSQAKTLMDKLHDSLKTSGTRLPALQLVLYLVYKELSWCHKLVEMPLFSSILKCLETETDVPILMTGLMMIVILLPSVPVGMGPHLNRIFDIFKRLAIFCVKTPANTPEVFVLHLQVALYSLFQRLYGMYPCSFIAFVGKFCSSKENILIYEEVLMPMLERVRLHPKLITGQNEPETSANRWKNQETHDIIVNCSKLSLDLIEGSWEDSRCPVFHSMQSVDKYRLHSQDFPYGEKDKASTKTGTTTKMIDDSTSVSSLFVPSLDASAVGESPSVLIGLSTPPPSQRTTPASSFVESGSAPNILFDAETTPRQHTPSQTEEGERTPLSRSSSRGTIQHSKSMETKRPSLMDNKMAMPVPHTTPVTPGSYSLISPTPYSPTGSVGVSPLKSKPSAFGAPALRSPAARSLQFEKSLEEENEDAEEASSSVQGLASSKPSETEIGVTTKMSDDGHRRKSQDLATAGGLRHVIGESAATDIETLDQEVEAINERVDQFDECTSPSSSVSTLTSQTDVTAESVRQFMKKVNRIRFNSLTSNSSSDLDSASLTQGVPNQRTIRPRSCPPPLKRHGLPVNSAGEGSLTPRSVPKNHSSAREQSAPGRAFGRHISMVDAKSGSEGCQKNDRSSTGDAFSSVAVSSQAGLARNRPQPRLDSCGVEAVNFIPPLPDSISPVFQFLFAPSKLAICGNCRQQAVVVSDKLAAGCTTVTAFKGIKGNDVSLFSLMSPPELLDRHIRLGSDIHAKELNKIPLTSKESTNWTHFGGVPPADEVNILRGQILLVQNQLMYERHKRSNHAKRNRRLLRRITHIAMLEEQQKSLMAQSSLHEAEIQQLRLSVKLLQEDNRRLRQSQESDEYEKLVQFRTSLKENKDMKATSVVLKNLLLTQKEENDKQQKKLESMQHKALENEKDLEICREKLAFTDKLSQRVFQLQKEVLLTQEFHQKCQAQLQQSRATCRHRMEESGLINSLKSEIADLSRDNKRKSTILEAYQTRLGELEQQVKAKDTAVEEVKQNFEGAKNCHNEQLQAVEERCRSMQHMIQQLEAKVMELTCQLDQTAHRKMLEAKKTTGSGGDGGGSTSSTTTAPSEPDDSNRDFEPSKSGSTFSKTGFSASKPGFPVKQTDTNASETSDSSRGLRKFPSLETGGGIDVVRNTPGCVTVVVAKDQVSVASSTFTDNHSMALNPNQLPPASSRDRLTDVDILSDSGTASRTSFRTDNDVSMKSVSGHSLATGDSGCWPKE